MRSIQRSLIICFSLLLALPLQAQLDQYSSPSGYGNTYRSRTKNEVKNVVGTPFLNEEFTSSVIKVKDGTLYEEVMLRYNIMSDEIEFLKSDGQVRAMSNREETQWAIIGKDTIVTRMYGQPEKHKYRHFIMLQGGELQLLLKKKKRFREATEPQGYSKGTDPAYVDGAREFYLCFGADNVAQEVPKKKELESFFRAKGETISGYMKQEKLSLKKEEDLLQLVRYYNSL